ncbi:hypothetical protein BDR07DRAFT_350699 [Suillus spraguei]|nr:hypothetical protein BDR07DRAFT_350699 [Suillus spraguei]
MPFLKTRSLIVFHFSDTVPFRTTLKALSTSLTMYTHTSLWGTDITRYQASYKNQFCMKRGQTQVTWRLRVSYVIHMSSIMKL